MTPGNAEAPPRIVVVSADYPSTRRPHAGAFVEALVRRWSESGVPVDVISPCPWWGAGHRGLSGSGPTPVDPAGRHVLRPLFLSYSARPVGPHFNTARLSARAFRRSALRASRALMRPDVVYAHFLFPSGFSGLALGATWNVPVVTALGESNLNEHVERYGKAATARTLRAMSGLLSVSEENRTICAEQFRIDRERIELIPNATDVARFHPRDRAEMRRKLGLPAEARIVAFTGHFIERKGPLRLLEALRRTPDAQGVFLGDGPQRPAGDRVLFAGRVPHDRVGEWLCAADLFALPTLTEGSPNAVIEAMACGLPIVSSDIPSLRETVDPESAVLVDPTQVGALADAIAALLAEPGRRRRLGESALERARRFTLAERARRILELIERVRRTSGA